jgi:hypothetical protein
MPGEIKGTRIYTMNKQDASGKGLYFIEEFSHWDPD